MRKRSFLVGTHQTAVAPDIRAQNSCQPPLAALSARCSRRTPKLVEIEWYISELWADVPLYPSPKRGHLRKSDPATGTSVLLTRTDVVRLSAQVRNVPHPESRESAVAALSPRCRPESTDPGWQLGRAGGRQQAPQLVRAHPVVARYGSVLMPKILPGVQLTRTRPRRRPHRPWRSASDVRRSRGSEIAWPTASRRERRR
jgi:hypothetical protein